jgi:hypothetical protein
MPAKPSSTIAQVDGSGTEVIEPEVTMLSVETVSPSNPANELTGGSERLNGLTAPPAKPAEVVNSRKVAPLGKRNTSQETPPQLDADSGPTDPAPPAPVKLARVRPDALMRAME